MSTAQEHHRRMVQCRFHIDLDVEGGHGCGHIERILKHQVNSDWWMAAMDSNINPSGQ